MLELDSIGFHITNKEEWVAFVRGPVTDLVEADLPEVHRSRYERHLSWTDSSGASLALHLEGDQPVCLTPFFRPPEGPARWRVTSSAARDEEACAHCGGADCDILANGKVVTRATLLWLNYRPFRSWLGAERTYDLEVVALARRVELYPDEAAFDESSQPLFGGHKLAANFFLPYGMFNQEAGAIASANVAMAGRVVHAELRQNTRGGAFWWIRMVSMAGEVDVVAPPAALANPPQVGNIASVYASLVGRPLEAPPEPGWCERLKERLWPEELGEPGVGRRAYSKR